MGFDVMVISGEEKMFVLPEGVKHVLINRIRDSPLGFTFSE
jgi:hypothetical protein